MENFSQKFIIHPVGQGFFYSCTIKHQHKVKFRMVFDCGSNTKGAAQYEVEIYRDSDFLKQKILDMLVISHFDSDHVNSIGLLLADKVKVKRLVMPFITFEERLFLLARHVYNSKGYKDEDDFFLRFIIDPLGTLSDNLNGDSEVYLIEGDPDNPISPESDEELNDENFKNETRFQFGFTQEEKKEISLITTFQTSLSIKGKVFTVKDANKGRLKVPFEPSALMDFLFYKRSVGEMEESFFKKVEELFNERYGINSELTGSKKLSAIIETVKTIKSATKLKKIFKDAMEFCGLKARTNFTIDNLNTTALCLLHRNLKSIFQFLTIDIPDSHFYQIEYPYINIHQIQKFIPQPESRIEVPWNNFGCEYGYYMRRQHFLNYSYPNTLLTSDTFLLTEEQTREFFYKYKNYWGQFWLFQIPHHGSAKNSDKLLHSSIPLTTFNFINFGIGNKDKHPSASVISDLAATGNSSRIISINQFVGFKFEYGIEY